MRGKNDHTGQTFGRLTVIREAGHDHRGYVLWTCQCTCGTEKAVPGVELRRGDSKSCGCLQREVTADRNTTHGLSDHRLYGTWMGMLKRCFNPRHKNYPSYGGRGITVCETWADRATGLAQFIADMDATYKPGLTLDRIDNDGPYVVWNCRWATKAEQSRNASRTRLIEYGGRTLCLTDWAELLGLPRDAIRHRLNRLDWQVSRALTEGVDPARLAALGINP
jgi:hypothetical protein